MFIIYRITNKGEGDQTRLFFSQIVDYGLGQDEDDDNATYDPFLDLVYGWDSDGVGVPTQAGATEYELGYTGFAFLESPANDVNGEDDDLDGITDESRFDENYLLFTTFAEIDAYVESQYDVNQFAAFYGEQYFERPAYTFERWFTTDENLDWVGFEDANENGIFDEGETLNNDVGRDGLSPFDIQYPGPDEGEGDGIPTNGEPNYNELDVDESDQIGLRGFDLNTRPFYESGDNLRDDTGYLSELQKHCSRIQIMKSLLPWQRMSHLFCLPQAKQNYSQRMILPRSLPISSQPHGFLVTIETTSSKPTHGSEYL